MNGEIREGHGRCVEIRGCENVDICVARSIPGHADPRAHARHGRYFPCGYLQSGFRREHLDSAGMRTRRRGHRGHGGELDEWHDLATEYECAHLLSPRHAARDRSRSRRGVAIQRVLGKRAVPDAIL